jgi:L-amino acid N-acyltransferase YncA
MQQINIKKTNISDCNKYFTIRNNFKNRRNSLNTSKIKIEDHNKWFSKNYKNKYYFTCYKGKSKIGYIRGDLIGDTINISIALETKSQNRNIGTQCLKLFEKKINNNCILIAKIKKKNLISIRFFEKNGFSELSSRENILTFYKIKNNSTDFYLNTINEIEKVRKKNNINWMNILRLAFKNSPKETSKVFKQIHLSDGKISKLSKKLF